MKKVILAVVSLVVVLLIVYTVSGDKDNPGSHSEYTNDVEWIKFDTGLKQAAEDGKYLIVYFWRDGCPWCTRMLKDTFANEKIVDLVNAYFTPVKVKTTSKEIYHTDKGDISASQLARSFKMRGVPATFFLKPDGAIITNVPGYVPADKFELILKYLGEEHYQNKSFEEYQKSLKESS